MRCRLKHIVIVLTLLGLVLGLPFAYYQIRSWQAHHELADLIAELDRTASPWRLADLEARRPTIADEKNGAKIVKAARLGNRAVALLEQTALDLPPNRLLAVDVHIKLRECLENAEANVKEARRLVDFPEGQFHVKIAPDVISTLLPEVQDLREIGLLLKHDVYWQLEQGNFDQAVASCRAGIHASRLLRDDLFLISHLVRLAILREIGGSVERLLAQGEPPAKLLPELQRLLLDEADFDGWTVAIAGERAGMHQFLEYIAVKKLDMRNLRGLSGMRTHWHHEITDRFMAANTHQSHIWILRHLTDVLSTKPLPPQERHARMTELNERVQHAPQLAHTLMAPGWKSIHPVFPRTDARLQTAAAGLASEQFRRKHLRWPRSLDELTPEVLAGVPFDAYTGNPLQLRPTADGIVIYSVGPDGNVCGNALDEPKSVDRDMRRDHEFRLWNPALRRQK